MTQSYAVAKKLPETTALDLADQCFGELTCLRPVGKDRRGYRWLCRCSCGGFAIRHAGYLRHGAKLGQVPACAQCNRELTRGIQADDASRRRDVLTSSWAQYGSLYSPQWEQREADDLRDVFTAAFGDILDETETHQERIDAREFKSLSRPARDQYCPACGEREVKEASPPPLDHGYECPKCKQVHDSLFVCTICFAYQCLACTPDAAGGAYSLEQVGLSEGVSRERIRQIEAKGLRKLRHPARRAILQAFWMPDLTPRELSHLATFAPSPVPSKPIPVPVTAAAQDYRDAAVLARERLRYGLWYSGRSWHPAPKLTERSDSLTLTLAHPDQELRALALRAQLRRQWPGVRVVIESTPPSQPKAERPPRPAPVLPAPPPPKPPRVAPFHPWRCAQTHWVARERPSGNDARRLLPEDVWDPTHVLRLQYDGYRVLIPVHAVLCGNPTPAYGHPARWVMLFRKHEWGIQNCYWVHANNQLYELAGRPFLRRFSWSFLHSPSVLSVPRVALSAPDAEWARAWCRI
jgi:RNA polymerase primary sigma factor